MTSKLTRERLEKIKSWRETYGAGSNVMLPAEEAEELARMALAAMDSDPVVYMWDSKRNDIDVPGFYFPEHLFFAESNVKQWGGEIIPLYRHAQQPVVPDDVLAALQKVARIRLDLNDFDGDRRGIADCLGDAEEALIEVVNRRAVMLAAAPQLPGSELATVPGKWIPVSERMPEDGQHIIIFCDDAFVLSAQYRDGEFFDVVRDGDEFFETTSRCVTHWMPLPAAPQEVKGD